MTFLYTQVMDTYVQLVFDRALIASLLQLKFIENKFWIKVVGEIVQNSCKIFVLKITF